MDFPTCALFFFCKHLFLFGGVKSAKFAFPFGKLIRRKTVTLRLNQIVDIYERILKAKDP